MAYLDKTGLQKLISKIKSELYNSVMPIGAVYTQYPLQLPPQDLFGGEWQEISTMYKNLVFRASPVTSYAVNPNNEFEVKDYVITNNYIGSISYCTHIIVDKSYSTRITSNLLFAIVTSNRLYRESKLINGTNLANNLVKFQLRTPYTCNNDSGLTPTYIYQIEDESLPNITGNTGFGLMTDVAVSGGSPSGALYHSSTPRNRTWQGTSGDDIRQISFDASKSNSIYSGEHVVPKNARIRIWKRIA